MEKDIKQFIRECKTCLRHNKIDAKHKAPLQKTDTINKPFVKVAIDIIGPLKETRTTKSKYALTVIDMGSRWIEVIPLRVTTAESVCNALLPVFLPIWVSQSPSIR